tara:strand:- start:252 stop:752 length:501 start_codon:yes stop_codon:yes gene_type:complete
MAGIATIINFMVKNGTQAAIKKFGKKAIREISKSVTDKSLHGGPKGFEKGGSVYMQSDKDEKPLTDTERRTIERMLRGMKRDREERESMGLDPDEDVFDTFLNRLMPRNKTKPDPDSEELALRKGGQVKPKPNTRKPREFAAGGAYKGKKHMYAAGGRVMDTRRKK